MPSDYFFCRLHARACSRESRKGCLTGLASQKLTDSEHKINICGAGEEEGLGLVCQGCDTCILIVFPLHIERRVNLKKKKLTLARFSVFHTKVKVLFSTEILSLHSTFISSRETQKRRSQTKQGEREREQEEVFNPTGGCGTFLPSTLLRRACWFFFLESLRNRAALLHGFQSAVVFLPVFCTILNAL